MIVERPKGPFTRGFIRFMGYGDRFLNRYIVPDVLNHTVDLPGESKIHLIHGIENVQINCHTPTGSFALNTLVPPDIRFAMHSDNLKGYAAELNEKVLYIPANRYDLEDEPVAAILHEGGHLWSCHDAAFAEQENQARDVLKYRLELAVYSLPLRPGKRAQHQKAWDIIGESEQRATASAIYTIGRMREVGIDPVPHLLDSESIKNTFNRWLDSHENFSPIHDIQFSQEDVDALLLGHLPYPEMKAALDSHLEVVLPQIIAANSN